MPKFKKSKRGPPVGDEAELLATPTVHDAKDSPQLQFQRIQGWKNEENKVISLECSVPTGFEEAAQREVSSKLNLSLDQVVLAQGRVIFDLPNRAEELQKVLKLRTVDNVYLLMGAWSYDQLDTTGPTEEVLQRLISAMDQLNWDKYVQAWKEVHGFKGILWPKSELDDPETKKAKTGDDTQSEDTSNLSALASFRCTCYRSGEGHSFSSMDAAREVGGAIQDKFGWRVRMKGFDLEVILNIIGTRQVYFALGLSKISLFKRNIEHFGPTTLRATICASLLQLADIKQGDIVVDPLCGGGSIPIEGAVAYNQGFHIGGDLHEKAFARTAENIKSYQQANNVQLALDTLRWDAKNIPLRNGSVDVLVSDLPFGKRSGSKADNRVLYPQILSSMARAVRPVTGRAVLLTQDKTSMFKSFGKVKPYWKMTRCSYANIGGLAALVFLLQRTSNTPDQ